MRQHTLDVECVERGNARNVELCESVAIRVPMLGDLRPFDTGLKNGARDDLEDFGGGRVLDDLGDCHHSGSVAGGVKRKRRHHRDPVRQCVLVDVEEA